MKRWVIPSIIVVLSLYLVPLFIQAQQPVATSTSSQQATHPPTRAELLALTNKARADNGLPALVEDSRLDQSAQFKADDEVKNHYFGHYSPIDGTHNGHDKLHELWPDCEIVDENLTQNSVFNDADHAMNAWMNSPPHRTAILNPKNIAVGFGIAGDQIVQHFCANR